MSRRSLRDLVSRAIHRLLSVEPTDCVEPRAAVRSATRKLTLARCPLLLEFLVPAY